MKIFISIIIVCLSITAQAQSKKTIKYEYKKLEKFDFDEIGVEGEAGSPGDLSITPQIRNDFKNKLPERLNFNKEMRKAIEGIR